MDALRKLLAKAPAAQKESGGKTWFRRGDAEQARKEAYLEEKRKADEAKAAKEEETRQAKLEFSTRRRLMLSKDIEAEEARNKRQKVAEDSHKAATGTMDDDDSDADAPIEFEEVCDRLRELEAPITLFGESDMRRYRRLTILELQHQNLTAHGPSRADARGKKRENIGGGDYSTGADLGFGMPTPAPGGSPSPGESPRPSDDEAEEKDKEEGADGDEKDDKDEDDADDAEEEVDERVALIRTWIRSLMRAWEEDLQERDGDQKKTAAAKAESQQYRQSKQHLRPLLKGMKKGGGALPEMVLARLHEIVQLCEEKKYSKANDVYIALAMGNSGFAVGATALQLKEKGRGGKLDTANDSRVAHALNDETTRKFIQAFKRLVTQCEQRNPA